MDVRQGRLTLDITAPDRVVQVVHEVDGRVESLASEDNPIGRIAVVFEPPAMPEVDERGGLRLGISVDAVAGSDADERRSSWKVDSLQLELAGQVR
jgi:hypothetical protein